MILNVVVTILFLLKFQFLYYVIILCLCNCKENLHSQGKIHETFHSNLSRTPQSLGRRRRILATVDKARILDRKCRRVLQFTRVSAEKSYEKWNLKWRLKFQKNRFTFSPPIASSSWSATEKGKSSSWTAVRAPRSTICGAATAERKWLLRSTVWLSDLMSVSMFHSFQEI